MIFIHTELQLAEANKIDGMFFLTFTIFSQRYIFNNLELNAIEESRLEVLILLAKFFGLRGDWSREKYEATAGAFKEVHDFY